MNVIRKISVGVGHPDQMMHYQIGKNYTLSGVQYKLSDIVVDRELLEKGKLAYNLYIIDSSSKLLWKTIINVPCVVEYDITFK